jgi:uncharacterized protein
MAMNTICHLEISSKDSLASSKFYESLFGWKMEMAMGEEYIFFNPETPPGGGISKVDEITPGGGIIFYVEVEDIDAYLAKAEELGGKIVKPQTPIPGFGAYGQFSDLDRNIIGLYKSAKG